jgi:hypothetical protein
MWQTGVHIRHALTCICRAFSAASSSSLELVFGSIQLHRTAIETLPEEETNVS